MRTILNSKTMIILLLIVVVKSLTFCSLFAQNVSIPIETENNALVLQADDKKNLEIIYFGKKLKNTEEYSQVPAQFRQSTDDSGILNAAYTASGSRNLVEPAISVTHADGNKSLDLKYVSHQSEKIDDNISLTSIKLKDPVYPFEVTLFYKTYKNENVIEQWTQINHNEKGEVILHKYASANLHIKADEYWLTHYHGQWAKEMRSEETKLTSGIKTLDSKLGTRANLYMPSMFMVSLDKPSAEDEGTVLLGAMEWSGNFRIDLEVDPQHNLRLIAGMNNFASDYHLKPNENFTTPEFLYAISQNGKGEASRNLHSWARDYKLLDGNGERLTLLNNWEATYFDFNSDKLEELIRDAKKLGVDLFLLDDGWFANKYPRNSDRAGLGDWQVNRKKLPDGISTLVEEATQNGIKFGIWVEPEMVNPKSELYEKHPDWVIRQPEREEYYFRNQLVLDLSNPEVQDFVYDVIEGLFKENPELAYIKWDCNAVIYNAHSIYQKYQSHLYVDYVKGLYNVLERIRKNHPKVPMMLCSGGGGRVDYGALKYFTEFWPSDNTDPLERIYMQWEYSYFYPSIAMAAHVTNWGNQSIKFKTDVAMMGKLGFDIVVDELNEKDLVFCQDAVKNYNRLKDVIWHGDQYRLSDPRVNDVASLMYVNQAKSKAVVFNYSVNNRFDKGSKNPVKLKGLDPDKKYKITEINVYPDMKSPFDQEKIYSGDFLETVGINPLIFRFRQSVVLVVEEI